MVVSINFYDVRTAFVSSSHCLYLLASHKIDIPIYSTISFSVLCV